MLDDLPLGLLGNAGGIGVLTLIILYLLRQLALTRKDDAARLVAIDEENDRRLRAERDHRAEERTAWLADRAWLREFYENRHNQVSARYEEEVTALRGEVADLRQRLNDVRAAADEERQRRREAEEQLAAVQAELATLQLKQAKS